MPGTDPTPQGIQVISRAIVTGASGFIGSALVLHLLERNVKVIAFGSRPSALPCECHVADMRTPGVLDPFLDEPSVVFHMASRADVGASVSDPRGDFEHNISTAFEVLESVRNAGGSLVYPSTASVFDSMNALPLSETAYVKPTSPYAAGKAAGEAYCAAYHRSYNIDVRVARIFSVYGAGMNRLFIHDLIHKIQRDSRRVEIRGDGQQIRDYLYIDDVVRGLVRIAEFGEAGQDYNLASGIPVRILDLAARIAALMGYPGIEIVPDHLPSPGDVPRWYADISKMQSIGFTPQVTLEEGLRRTIDYFLKRQPSIERAT